MGLFVEDDGHRALLHPLVERLAEEESVQVRVEVRNAEGGAARALAALRQYGIDLERGMDDFLDILLVALDGNCHGRLERRRQIEAVLQDRYPGRLVTAVPDPHVELWYLADPRALPAVLGEELTAEVPQHKCERHRYKQALRQACRRAGVDPVADGVEFGGEVAASMDLERAVRNDEALDQLVGDLRAALRGAAHGGGE